MKLKPFRFGVNVRTAGSSAEWVDKARKAEALGYAVLLVPDHLADLFAPMLGLTAAAAATARLRVGTGVLNNDFRHPVLVAREAATLDVLRWPARVGPRRWPYAVRVRAGRSPFRSRGHSRRATGGVRRPRQAAARGRRGDVRRSPLSGDWARDPSAPCAASAAPHLHRRQRPTAALRGRAGSRHRGLHRHHVSSWSERGGTSQTFVQRWWTSVCSWSGRRPVIASNSSN
jgi:hypothetical protein